MNKNQILGLTLLRTASKVEGFHIKDAYNLEIDYVNGNPEDEDEMVVTGKYCTIFADDLQDCVIKGNTIYIKGQYILHLK